MSNYTKITDFGAKDSLISGDPLKVVKGSEIDDEFDAIATAVASKYDTATANTALDAKADLAGDTFTGPVVLPAGTAAAPSLTFVSDTNTGISNPAADTLGFSTGGTIMAQLNNSGLAVGDYLSAAYPLEAWKNSDGIIARFARGNGTNNPRLEVSAVESTKTLTLDATGSTSPNFEIKTGGTTRMSFNTTGQVGIGTSPNSLAMLNVEGVTGWTASGWYKSIRLPQTRAIQFTGASKHYGVGASGDEFYIFSTTAEDGSAAADYRLRIYSSGQIGIPAQYSNTTASAANAVVDSLGVIYRSTSSRKYKEQIEDLYPSYANKILEFRPVWYRSKADRDRKDWSYYGFIAEEVAEIEPRFVEFRENEDGTLEPEGIQYDRMVVPIIALVQQQQKQIEALEARLTALEAK
jgi:hypothetical protein